MAAGAVADDASATMTVHTTTQAVYAASFAVAMIGAGLAKRRLEWRRRERGWTLWRQFRRSSSSHR